MEVFGSIVGSILIPALIFIVGLTYKKEKDNVARLLIIGAIVYTTITLVVNIFNPAMTYYEPSVTVDDSMMKDYGHGVTAPDPVKVRIAQRKSEKEAKWVVDTGKNAARIVPKILLIIVMAIVLAAIPKEQPKKAHKKAKTKVKPSSKKGTRKSKDDFDDGL